MNILRAKRTGLRIYSSPAHRGSFHRRAKTCFGFVIFFRVNLNDYFQTLTADNTDLDTLEQKIHIVYNPRFSLFARSWQVQDLQQLSGT